ncbi:NAD(P)-binding protein [Imleria badia]|nr:NAD(P)-binding protein [Imleria badia]
MNVHVPPFSVTGASSGFGKSLTEFVLAKGDIVVATLRKPEVLQELSASYSKERLLVLKVDVINQADIDLAFARTKEVFGRLDVVFNNAGYLVLGDAETTPIDTARSLFDVNFWGAVNVSRAAIKFFREVNEPGRGGVLLQNSSVVAVEALPGAPFYSAREHVALDGVSEALAMEILPQWNIKICIIQTGGFGTNVAANAMVLPDNPIYEGKASILANVGKFIQLGDPAKFVKAIYSLVEGGKMPLHLPIGQDTLGAVQRKVESLGKEISEAAPWSADLLYDDINIGGYHAKL